MSFRGTKNEECEILLVPVHLFLKCFTAASDLQSIHKTFNIGKKKKKRAKKTPQLKPRK